MNEDLRNQTRTTRQVIEEYLNTKEPDDRKVDFMEGKLAFEALLWVPVAAAEQLEKDGDLLFGRCRELEQQKEQLSKEKEVLEVKLAESEKKVVELETKCCTPKNCCVLVSHEILSRKRTQYWKEKKALEAKQTEIEKNLDAVIYEFEQKQVTWEHEWNKNRKILEIRSYDEMAKSASNYSEGYSKGIKHLLEKLRPIHNQIEVGKPTEKEGI